MRIRVAVRVADALKRFKKIKGRDGSNFMVNFKYENCMFFALSAVVWGIQKASVKSFSLWIALILNGNEERG